MPTFIWWLLSGCGLLIFLGDFAWGVYKTIKSQQCPLCHHLKLLHIDNHGCVAEGLSGCACGVPIREMV
jgi:hypothetical protein